MAEDWLADVRKYAPGADEHVVGAIVKYLGIALRNRDSSLVAFSSEDEVGRVRERFLRKKLALTDSEAALNQGLDWVKGVMSGDRTKNRVTVYYLLAHYFGKLDLFGGQAGTSAASLGGPAAGLGGAAAAGLASANAPTGAVPGEPPAPSEPDRATMRIPDQTAAPPSRMAFPDDDRPGRSGWPQWLTWLLIALAVVALFFLLRSCMAERSAPTADTTATEAPKATDSAFAGETNSVATDATASSPTAVPTGAGVVSEMRDNRPMLTVYFESGRADVSNDISAAAGTLKAYLDAHAGSRLAISGYNDPSGNAALNAALSRRRAQGVATALAAAGISQGSIELVRPANTTATSVTAAQARRVEVTVQ